MHALRNSFVYVLFPQNIYYIVSMGRKQIPNHSKMLSSIPTPLLQWLDKHTEERFISNRNELVKKILMDYKEAQEAK